VDIEGEGPSMVIVDTDRPGVSVSRRFSSLDGSQHAAFRFEEVRVPRHHAIGAPGEGRSRALDKISAVRRAVAADCIGMNAWILELVAQDLRKQRRGTSKGDHEGVRLRFGEMRMSAYAARSMVYRTARLVDAGENVVNETIAAKVFASEVANKLVDMAVQLVGGEALVAGHPLEAALRRLRGWRLAEGESDTLLVNLSRGFLDLGKGRI
jgi:alkylation response protein AidB-like acyl-CoA dehydrogenase